MKNLLISLLICLLSWNHIVAGNVLESLSFQSRILNQEVRYSIYLPDDYESSLRKYPVLYLLHGWTDDETSWIQMGNMKDIADKAFHDGKSVPMIIVMPDAGETWYVNSYDKKTCYEDMFVQELIPYIEKNYRARTQTEYRAIAGLSMGGYGSFLYTLHHPHLFSACAPLSAAVYTKEMVEKSQSIRRNTLFEKLYGKGILTEHWKDNNVIQLMQNLPTEQFPQTRYYIDCGDEDRLLEGNYQVHILLTEKQIPHEFRVRDGGHCWTYWRTALPSVLEFVSKAFQRS